jgi:hypothetical protein
VGVDRFILADDDRMGDPKAERFAVNSSGSFIVHKYLTNL